MDIVQVILLPVVSVIRPTTAVLLFSLYMFFSIFSKTR
jgi:hypothetical protein